MIPNDPTMLLSFINMKLRDRYQNLSDLCEDMDIDETEITQKLEANGCHYDGKSNQFQF